ncbi:ABC transporter substrate-binding protein [Roseomonas sp. OT10]|uniref:ABC transporter substrate-binding protein n=1 Tax=Roseomonas cutis TaxID=2897332 RepID=UPI001E38BFC5|nr:ABC transporter substrate-binding protein [Roseomonas sp. OT10]UFN48378.1 ABC transporter substrate-binding protein [Roseomonas sp. OT10]
MRHRATLLLAALACAPAATAALGQELRLGVSAEITSADPHFQSASPNNALWRHLYEPLVGLSETGESIPALAASWRLLAPDLWEFTLREGARFADGSPMTAEDVAFSLRRPPTVPNSPSSLAVHVRTIAEITVVDDRTLRLRTAQPDPILLQNLAAVAIVAKRAAEGKASADFASGGAGLGSGPYRFVSWVPGQAWVIARNPLSPVPQPWARVTFRPVSGNAARTAGLLAGDLDGIEQVPTADLPRLRGDARFTVISGVSTRLIYLQPDTAREQSPQVTGPDGEPIANPLRDPRVRRAMSLAIDRRALVERVMEGEAVPAGQFLPDGFFGTSPALHPDKADPAAARKLLAEAGWPQGFRLVLAGPNNRYVNDRNVMQAVAPMLTRIGIRTEVQAEPFAVFIPRMSRQEASLGLAGLATVYGDAARQIGGVAESFDAARGSGNFNYLRYSNPELDALMQRIRTTMEPEARRALTARASEVAMADLPVIPLYFQKASWALRRGLTMPPHPAEYTLATTIRPE